MSELPVVGIVGAGTVGSALRAAFEGRLPVMLRDPALGSHSTAMKSLVDRCAVVFVAVPTPMGTGGSADLSVYQQVISEFAAAGGLGPGAPVLCIKSAVPPYAVNDTTRAHPELRLVVSPEFLRQRSPVADMLAMRALVLGGVPEDCSVVETLFREHSNVAGPMRTSPGLDAVGAAFLKYQENCFLAAKVSFMNEFYDLFQACGSGASWEALQTAFHLDHERMGTTHWRVPGPDGKRGWGGHCLPKDVAATQDLGRRLGVATPVLDAIRSRNTGDRER